MSTRPKLALVYDAIYPYSKGGAERRYYELGRELTALGYDVHLYGMKYWDGPSVITRDGLTLHGICKARPLYTTTGRRSITQPLFFGLACFKLIGETFDIIDCCGFPYFSLFPSKLAALRRHKPMFATWHEVWGKQYWAEYLGKLGFIGYAVERLASKLPSHIIAASQDTAARLTTELGVRQPISIVANGVDLSEVKAASAAPHKSDVLYAGRLVDFKNVDLLIRAVALLKPTNPHLTATIVGDGPAASHLKDLAKSLGIASSVTFTGFLKTSSDVYGYMKSSRVFVSPSAREGFGITLIEAAAAGIPVITANFPGNAGKDLITPETGSVIEPTPEALADAISFHLANPKPAETYQDYARKFEWSTLSHQLAKALS